MANTDWYSGTSSTADSSRYVRYYHSPPKAPPRFERMTLVDEIIGELRLSKKKKTNEPEKKKEPLLFDIEELYL